MVPRVIGLADYAVFAVFWAFMYLVIGALFGIQQEVTRGTRLVETTAPHTLSRSRNFAIAAAVGVFALITGTAPAWAASAFPQHEWSLVLPLAVGTASFVVLAVLIGTLYGLSEWAAVAALMLGDAVLRLAAVSVALVYTTDVVVLAWAVACPFLATVLVAWPLLRRRIANKTQLDVGYRRLTWNVARTVTAATSTGVMVSGLPLLLGLTSRDVAAEIVGLYILTLTLSRAPLIVVAMSLQSYLIVVFRDGDRWARTFARLQAVVVASGAVLAVLGWWLGPLVFAFLFPGALVPEGSFIALLVGSSALVASLCICAPALLASDRHVAYSTGWLVAAVVTIVCLLTPTDFETRANLALVAGPLAGLIVTGTAIAVGSTRRSAIS